ncbi:MAG: hemolysin family protein [Candidatus Thiodiazotropha sp.]
MGILEFFAFDTAHLADPDVVFRIGLQGLLFTLSFYFSGSETALFSLSPLDLKKLHRKGHRHAGRLEALLEQPRRLIISILCGNELVNIAATANLAGLLVQLYGADRAGLINLIVMFPLLLLLGEITPKTIAVSSPVKISTTYVAGPLTLWVKVVTPLRNIVRIVADFVTTAVVGKEKSKSNLLNTDEFRTIITSVEEGSVLGSTERTLVNNLLTSSETEIIEIMTQRTRIDFLNAANPLSEIIERFLAIGHSRVPVWADHRDNIIGMLCVEDVVDLVREKADLSKMKIEDILRPPVVVPLTKTVEEVFEFIRSKDVNSALVLNEYGGVEGLVKARDVLNFIFGELTGEVIDSDDYRIDEHNTYEVPGDMKLVEFNDLTNFGISDPRMTTIGGVAFRHFDCVPEIGDSVAVDGTTITVLDVDYHRIAKLRVAKGKFGPSKEDVARARNAANPESSGPPDQPDRATTGEDDR